MDQLRESGASIRRRRRRRRAAVTLTLVALVLLATFAYAAAYFQGWVGTRGVVPTTVASPACQVATPAKALAPGAVTVFVYNSTDRAGLAASVAKSLRTQGFKVGDVANDPLGRPISGVGEIRHGQSGAAGAALVAARLAGAKLVLDGRTDASVDLVLGDKFKVLRVPPKITPPRVAPPTAAKPTPSSSPSC